MAIINNTIDILLDASSELQENDGDFLVGDCGNNYIYYFTSSHLGHYKQFPLVGIGISDYLNSSANKQLLESNIIRQLKNDVFSTPGVDLTEWPDQVKINNVVVTKQ